MLNGLLDGEPRMFELPKGEFGLKEKVESAPPIHYGDWVLIADKKKRVIFVRMLGGRITRPDGSIHLYDERLIGWFPIKSVRKSNTVKVKNLAYGQPDFAIVIKVDTHVEVQVWLDGLEERGLLSKAPTDTLSKQELVANDPRVAEAFQEEDGFCDDNDSWNRGFARKAWWVYLQPGFINRYMGTTSIHECNLDTVLEQLGSDVQPMDAGERAAFHQDE